MMVNEESVVRNSNVLRTCKKEIDRIGNALKSDMSSHIDSGGWVYYSIAYGDYLVDGRTVLITPILEDWKTVIVEVSNTIAYIGIDLTKCFSYRIRPKYTYSDYTNRHFKGRQLIREYYNLTDDASDADIEKACSDFLKACRSEEPILTKRVKYKFNREFFGFEKWKVKNNDIKILPLMVFEFYKTVTYLTDTNTFGYKIHNYATELDGSALNNFLHFISYYLKPHDKLDFPWNIRYNVDNWEDWQILGS